MNRWICRWMDGTGAGCQQALATVSTSHSSRRTSTNIDDWRPTNSCMSCDDACWQRQRHHRQHCQPAVCRSSLCRQLLSLPTVSSSSSGGCCSSGLVVVVWAVATHADSNSDTIDNTVSQQCVTRVRADNCCHYRQSVVVVVVVVRSWLARFYGPLCITSTCCRIGLISFLARLSKRCTKQSFTSILLPCFDLFAVASSVVRTSASNCLGDRLRNVSSGT